jgi:hypothetical protein
MVTRSKKSIDLRVRFSRLAAEDCRAAFSIDAASPGAQQQGVGINGVAPVKAEVASGKAVRRRASVFGPQPPSSPCATLQNCGCSYPACTAPALVCFGIGSGAVETDHDESFSCRGGGEQVKGAIEWTRGEITDGQVFQGIENKVAGVERHGSIRWR